MFRHKSQAQFANLRDYLLNVVARNKDLGIDPSTVAYDPAPTTRLQRQEERQAAKEQEDYLKRKEQITNQLGGPGVARDDVVDAAASMHRRLGGGREIKRLLEHLQPGEVVRKIGQGTYHDDQGIVVLTNSRLVFLFHGVMRKALEDFPLAVISSVSTTSGMITGDLKVFAAGNEAVISNIIKDDLEPLANALRQEVARARAPRDATPAEQPGATQDPLSQIARLAELRDAGILTVEEFEAKKAELLGRL